MLLKKQENDNVTKAIYASSNVCASTYDRTTKNLTIIFNNGGQYRYTNVSETDYTRFELADSQGVIINSHIKKYAFGLEVKTVGYQDRIFVKIELQTIIYGRGVKSLSIIP
jgi:hypothetical protein